jgi:hypothetical protein
MRVRGIGMELAKWATLAALTLALAACGAEAPTAPDVQGWEFVGGGRGRTVVNPLEFMLAAGCSVAEGPGDSTRIGIKPILGPAFQFSCPGVPSDTVHAAMSRFVAADSAANGSASMMLGTWDVVSREYCYASAGGWQADGSYYLPPQGMLYDCFWVETYTLILPGGGNVFPTIPIAPGVGAFPTATLDSSLVDPPQPADVDPSWYNSLNRDEKWHCVADVQRCAAVGAYRSYAVQFALDSAIAHFASDRNTIYDGYRHALWSALMAQQFGQAEALWWGDTHEKYRPADESGEVCMDKHNNSVGRAIAASFDGVYHNVLQVEAAVVNATSSLWPNPGCQ